MVDATGLYANFILGCKLGLKCGINYFCSHLLVCWYYFVIYLSKIVAIPVFRPVTVRVAGRIEVTDNAKCRCLPIPFRYVLRSSNLASLYNY